jgi:tRNA(Ile)-lysidine synthase
MRDKLVEKMLDFCREENLIQRGDGIVVGLSSGVDSVCLLHLLYEMREMLGISLYVLHVHHMIRREEADRDAAMAENMADRLGLPFCLVRKDVKKIAEESGLTVEEAGRNVRYEAFESYRTKVGADKIAVAHHQNDQAETVLFHLLRGTGPRGLCGIPARRGCIIRPLLGVSESEIQEYVKEHHLKFAVDSTNLVPDYMRNKIRLTLLPYMERELNARAVRHIAETAEKNNRWKNYIEREGKRAFERIAEKKEGNIDIVADAFQREDPVMQDEVIRLVFSEFIPGAKDICQVHYEQARELFYGNSGRRIHFPGHLMAVREYDVIRFGISEKEEKENVRVACRIPSVHIVNVGMETFRFSFYLEKRADLPVEIPQKDYTKWFDYDMIKDGLVLRSPREGDYFVLNDRGDRKKLNRYYMDQKIPCGKRADQLVLASGSHVLWAIPNRISAACKITEQTKTVLVVTKEREYS